MVGHVSYNCLLVLGLEVFTLRASETVIKVVEQKVPPELSRTPKIIH